MTVDIIIKNLEGTRFNVSVTSSSTVLELQQRIQEVEPTLTVSKQRLIYNGVVLTGQRKQLSEYHVVSGATIYVIPKFDDVDYDQVSSELDLVFVVDCTASMGPYIKQAQQNIKAIVNEIVVSEKANVRVGLVRYRDYPPQDTSFITQVAPFTSSLKEIKHNVDTMAPAGGGDGPECLATGLHQSLQLQYRPGATRVCILITDAPPHGLEASGDGFPNGDPGDNDLMMVVNKLADNNLRLYCVGCEPALSYYLRTRSWMSYASDKTGGRYVSLSNAALLASVIIGGAREEINLDKLSAAVVADITNDTASAECVPSSSSSHAHQEISGKHFWDAYSVRKAKFASEDDFYQSIADRLNASGMTTVELQFNDAVDSYATRYKHLFVNAASLAEAKRLCEQYDKEHKNQTARPQSSTAQSPAVCETVPIAVRHIRKVIQRKLNKKE